MKKIVLISGLVVLLLLTSVSSFADTRFTKCFNHRKTPHAYVKTTNIKSGEVSEIMVGSGEQEINDELIESLCGKDYSWELIPCNY